MPTGSGSKLLRALDTPPLRITRVVGEGDRLACPERIWCAASPVVPDGAYAKRIICTAAWSDPCEASSVVLWLC